MPSISIHDLPPLTDAEMQEMGFESEPQGPSSRGVCRVTVSGSCGSGSLVGYRNGKSLVLTNAHVAGTRPGKEVTCQFPFLNNKRVRGRILMAGYSDRVMMDWCIIELDEKVDLPHTKLDIDAPPREAYTAGYPRCQGPRFQRIRTIRTSHNGTVWHWQPASISGQSGSAVHDFSDNFQVGILTWKWGPNGAGQSARAIWFQYKQRAVVGFERPEGLEELADVNNQADDLEVGFHAQVNITTLDIWAHIDGEDPDDPENPDPPSDDQFKAEVLKRARSINDSVDALIEFVRGHKPPKTNGEIDPDPTEPDSGDDSDIDWSFGL